MTINVIDQDIRLGARSNCFRCPVALTIKRIITNKKVEVGSREIYLLDRDFTETKFYNPKKVEDFINKFDNGEDVKPFSFNIDYEN